MSRFAILCAFVTFADCSIPKECRAGDLSCNPLSIFLFQQAAYPRFLYSGNLGATTVTGYAFNHLTGAISPVTSVTATPGCIAVHPNGQILYAANGGLNTITSFFINQTTGVLTSASSFTVASAGWMAIDSAGTFLYALNAGSNILETHLLNSQTGSATLAQSTSSGVSGPNALALHPYGLALYIANTTAGNVSSYAINPTTGSATLIGQVSQASARGVAVDPFGRFLYATDNTSTLQIYRINSNATLTSIGSVPTGVFNTFAAVTPDGRYVYTSNQTNNDVSVLSVQDAGVLINVANRTTGIGPIGISVDPFGKFLIVGNAGAGNVTIYSISRFTGDLTQVDLKSAGVGAQAFAFSNRAAF